MIKCLKYYKFRRYINEYYISLSAFKKKDLFLITLLRLIVLEKKRYIININLSKGHSSYAIKYLFNTVADLNLVS